MKDKLIACILLLAFTGCQRAEISSETETTEELTTATEKPSEIATESVSATTEAPLVIVTTESTTELMDESTGEVDENGYGWVQLQYDAPYHIIDDHLTRSNGVVYFNGHRETWYSTKEASGKATARSIPGKHVAEDGTIRDEDGYICVASSDLAFYSIVMTSVGPGKVYDCGCSSGTVDVYTDW